MEKINLIVEYKFFNNCCQHATLTVIILCYASIIVHMRVSSPQY